LTFPFGFWEYFGKYKIIKRIDATSTFDTSDDWLAICLQFASLRMYFEMTKELV